MKKHNAFNFVELLLVMLVLGVIISLTMPLLKKITDDDDIYRSYMKKANQEVIDAFTMGLIRSRARDITTTNVNDCESLRNFFNTSINGIECLNNINANDANACNSNNLRASFENPANANAHPFIILGGKSIMAFEYIGNVANDGVYGYVYIDMNGNKSPNKFCQDRYRFIVYRDRIAMDTDARNANPYACSFNLQF